MNCNTKIFLIPKAVAALFVFIVGVSAANATDKSWDGSEPAPGVYFYWYEPSFYTGFAPRTQDANRVHLELARGNQVRNTIVLGDEELDAYLEDLHSRRAIYQELIDAGIIELSVNKQYERFVEKLGSVGVEAVLNSRGEISPAEYREKTLEILRRLNPGRVFEIKIPWQERVNAWHVELKAVGELKSKAAKLDVVNALLPERLNIYALSPELEGALSAAVTLAQSSEESSAEFAAKAEAVLELASAGNYAVKDGVVRAIEFTAIYPAGTAEAWTNYQGTKLPEFGVTGVWHLIPRTKGKGIVGMVDYLSSNPGYGYISMLPYQYAGGIAYNAFHNAGVRSSLSDTPFLPKQWRSVPGERNPKKNYQNLWIISRGPTSHGCTRLASGHMSELRDLLPAESKTLEGVAFYRNKPQCYDVYDIDGSGAPKVMGVKYYLAFRSKGHTPWQAYVTNKREPYYQWLYGSNISLNPDGSATLKKVPICRFVGKKKAEEARVLENIPLYEADFEPESIQFYKLKPAAFNTAKGYEFNRELRKIGHGHQVDRAKLFLK